MARSFPGSTNTRRVDSGASYDPAGSFSVAAWVRQATAEDFKRVVSTRDAATHGFLLGVSSGANNNKIRFLVAVGGTFRVAGPAGAALDDGAWHLIVGSYTAAGTDVIDLYVDDMTATAASVSGTYGTFNNSATNLAIGNERAGASWNSCWNGDIGTVCTFDRVLTLGERQQLKKRGPAHLRTAGWWPLGLGSPEVDLSGNKNNGSIDGTGTTTVSDNPPIAPLFAGDNVISFPAGAAPSGRIMGSLVGAGGLAGIGGLAGSRGGMAG
jgi:hypothetical protein